MKIRKASLEFYFRERGEKYNGVTLKKKRQKNKKETGAMKIMSLIPVFIATTGTELGKSIVLVFIDFQHLCKGQQSHIWILQAGDEAANKINMTDMTQMITPTVIFFLSNGFIQYDFTFAHIST